MVSADPSSRTVRVSVVMPVDDGTSRLESALRSLQAQTFGGWEAIVIDDGSGDGCASVAKILAGSDTRIRLMGVPRRGLGAARNRGVAASGHEWVTFLDADDWVEPDHLDRMTRALAADPYLDVVHCGWVRVGRGGHRYRACGAPDRRDLFHWL